MSLSAVNLTLQLPHFEGPMALLLYLIRKEEMDIMDIKINLITRQYLDYIRMMREMDLELAGEFVAMAATLIQIKSQMLLPNYNENGEVIEDQDPRKVLVQKLLEYQKYQQAAALLSEKAWLGRNIFTRLAGNPFDFVPEAPDIVLEENALFGLISSFRTVSRNAIKRVHKVAKKMQSIAGRILELKNQLILGVKIPFKSLLDKVGNQRQSLLITFLSSLEMAKMGFVKLFQSENYQEIYLEVLKPIDEISLSRVEEYEHSTALADQNKLDPFESKVNLDDQGQSVFDQGPILNILSEQEDEQEDEQGNEQDKGLIDFGQTGEGVTEAQMATDDDIFQAELDLELGLDLNLDAQAMVQSSDSYISDIRASDIQVEEGEI